MNSNPSSRKRRLGMMLAVAILSAYSLPPQELPAGDRTTAPPDGCKVKPVAATASDLLVNTAAPPAAGVLPDDAEPEMALRPAFAAPVSGDENLRFARLISMDPGSGAGRDTWHDIPCPSPGAQEGDPCDCDDDCCGLTSADGCVRGECRESEWGGYFCEEVDALQNARCDGDANWCTLEWCDGLGTCLLLDDNAGGRMSRCPSECVGGGRDGLWCFVGSECPGGTCAIKPHGECNGSPANEEFCAYDAGSGDLGRCCNAGSCTLELEADCDAPALWRRIADPDDANHCWCPQYSSGIAPQDDEAGLVGKTRPSNKVCTVGGNRCEDATLDCVDRCGGGPNVGLPCGTDADCPGGSCQPDICTEDPERCADGYLNIGDGYSLESGNYMRLNEFRFRGGVENPGEVIVVEFYDTAYSPALFAGSFAMQIPRAGIFTWTYEVDCYPDCSTVNNEGEPPQPPFIIPPDGYVVMRSTREEEPAFEANFWWGSTTSPADVGSNDPDKMWVDGEEVNLLGAGNNTMMFELVGQVLDTDPVGACCVQNPVREEQCEDTPLWGCGLCTDTGDEVIRCSQGRDCGVAAGVQRFCVFSNWFGPQDFNDFIPPQAGELCGTPPTPCDRGACCYTDGSCMEMEPDGGGITCDGGAGVWLGPGTRCDPNCCPQDPTGADCACDTYICATGAECYTDRICSGSGAPCTTALECPIGDTCDPNYNGETCTYTGPGEPGGCSAGVCGALFTGSQCEIENGDADCDTGETCELACVGPPLLDMQLPGTTECTDDFGDPFDPSEPCTFGPAGDAQCAASAGCLSPPCQCEFLPGEPVSYAFTGDSSMAFFSRRMGDECNLDNDDLGWHEAFVFTNQTGDPANDCAIITVDFCCNETIKTPVWLILRSECLSGDCIWNSPMGDEFGNPAYGYGLGCGAQHCCEDGNYAASYMLYPGTYSWQIYGSPTCEGTVQDCMDDTDCDGGTQCLPNLGTYKGHFTIEACPIAACCIEDSETCVETNRLQCESSLTDDPPGLNGLWLGQGAVTEPVLDCGFAPCLFGACCLAPEDVPLGEPLCNDDQDHDTLAECKASTNNAGVYVGGVSCEDDPCPVCLIESAENCKPEDPAQGFIIQSNTANNVRVADDFRPANSSISKVCWAPAFLGPDGECSQPGQTPTDEWYITFYRDTGGGWPDDEGVVEAPQGPYLITVDAKVSRGVNSRVWDYSGRFDEVTVVVGECYWMEIQGTGSRTCYTYLTTGIETNAHGMYDVADYGDYQSTDARGDDYQFCLDCGIDGALDCGQYFAACCQCGDPPCEILTRADCDGLSPPGGFMLAENTCDPNPCPGIPDNNTCVNATALTGVLPASPDGVRVDFNNVCATDDGPTLGCGGGDLHFDIWYHHVGEANGDLVVTMCNLASFDTILAFYDGAGGPATACTPTHLDEMPAAIGHPGCNPPGSGGDCCGDDTCNITSGPSAVSMRIATGEEILIRVGGWYDAGQGIGDGKGWGAFNISYQNVQEQGEDPPQPEVGGAGCQAGAKFCHGGTQEGDPCLVNEDCLPNPGGMCLDDCWDEWSGASCVIYDHASGAARCYAPKNRYLTIDATQNTGPMAYHVALDTGSIDGLDDQYASCGVIQGFLSDPQCLDSDFGEPVVPQPPAGDPCQGVGLFGWVSYIEPGPATPRTWEEYPLFVTGCEVVPAATYLMTASPDGIAPGTGATMAIMTAHEPSDIPQSQFWGDVSGGPVVGQPGEWTPTDYTTSFADVSFVIKTYEKTGGPSLEWSDMEITHTVNFGDISFVISAFEGKTYPQITDINSPGGRPLIGHEPCDCP